MNRDFMAALFGPGPKAPSPPKAVTPKKALPPPEVSDDQPLNPFNELQLLSFHQDIVHTLVVVDETRIASVSDDVSVAIWDVQIGRILQVLSVPQRREDQSNDIVSVRKIKSIIVVKEEQYSKTTPSSGISNTTTTTTTTNTTTNSNNNDNKGNFAGRIIAAISDRTLCIWDCRNGFLPRIIITETLIQCLISLENDMFCGAGKTVHIWNAAGSLLTSSSPDKEHEEAHAILRLGDGKLILACENLLVSYHYTATLLTRHQILSRHRETITCLTDVSSALFASSSSDGAIIIWNKILLEPKFTFNYFENYIDPITHQNRYLVRCMLLVDHFLIAAIGNGFSVFETHDNTIIAEINNAHFAPINHIGIIEQTAIIVTCSEDASIRLWTLELFQHIEGISSDVNSPTTTSTSSPTSQRALKVHSAPLTATLSANSSKNSVFDTLLSPSKKKTILKPECIGEMTIHRGCVNYVLSVNHCDFVTCGSDGLVILWRDSHAASFRRNLISLEMARSGQCS